VLEFVLAVLEGMVCGIINGIGADTDGAVVAGNGIGTVGMLDMVDTAGTVGVGIAGTVGTVDTVVIVGIVDIVDVGIV
jgi:hypothetical protein